MTGGLRLGGPATCPGPGDAQAASGGRRNAQVQREVDESIAVQRSMLAAMVDDEHARLDDVLWCDQRTGQLINRGQAFDQHALHLWVWAERAVR